MIAGGGLSGLSAALFAAKAGKRTLLVTKGSGVLAIGGGTIDVLGYRSDGTPLYLALRRLRQPVPAPSLRHRRRGDRQKSAVLLPRVLRRGRLSLPLQQRTKHPRGDGPRHDQAELSCAAYHVDARRGRSGQHFHRRGRGAQGLLPGAGGAGPCDAQGVHREEHRPGHPAEPFPLQRDLSTLDLARYLDTPEGILWLSKSLNKYIVRGVPGAVFVPAILGTAANNDVHNAIKDRTGHIVNEISSLPPAVTGLRLHALLLRLLKKYDVDLIEQSTITGAVVENGRCAALITTNNGQERRYEARSFIIATGGVLGEGFAIEPERAWEPIFNIDLPLNPSSPEWSLPEAYPACRQTPGTPRPSHGFALLGPDVDAKLRPLGKDGNPLCGNVFFIGKTLGGYDHAAEKSGNGVALSTALFAAMNA